MTEIVIQVRPDAADGDSAEQLSSALGMRVAPLFPDSSDTAMQSWFSLTLPTDADPDQVVGELAGHPAVESAYVKPPDSAP